jgi:DNA-binding NtrC family response regulator
MALILVVDDEQDACTMVHRILAAKGHEVVTFTEGQRALLWLERYRPHLTVLDLKLPGMDGIALLRLIRENDPRAKVVILTAYPSAESASEALRLGAAKYLIKPIEIDELETNVEDVLSSNSGPITLPH